ncbi:MAG: alpha/beta fold hydrolase [Janthinobacterium lividum]
MKKLLLLFLPLLFPCLIFAQTEPKNYKQASMRFQKFYNQANADSLYSCFGAAVTKSISLDKTAGLITQLQTAYGKLNMLQFLKLTSPVAAYKASFEKSVQEMSLVLDAENKISGFFFKPYQENFAYKLSSGLTETPVKVNTADASLSGSLVVPEKTNGKIPVVLIIAGSGPTDRNGNSSLGITANSYYLLANDLGKAGIASLRYDKRAIGKSTSKKSLTDVRFEDFVADAVALIKQLKTDTRFSKVIVLGHSEGSLIGMLAAEKEKVDAYISLAGAGDAINKIFEVQLKNQTPEEYKLSMNQLDSLKKGLKVKAAENDQLFSPILQPYMISWMKYNPQTEIKKLNISVLILQGTTDIQVSVTDAEKLKKAKPNAKLVLLEGMNHALKQAPQNREQNIATYSNPALPIDATLVEAVTQFVNQLK